MLIRLTLIAHAVVELLRVTLDRVRRGPARPGWSWLDELVATAMKRHFARMLSQPWEVQRRIWATMALPPLPGRPRLRFERVRWAGMGALWIRPRVPAHEGAQTILYLHGGAYLFGSTDEYREFLARLARATGANVLAIDYRLAPEHPFPAALEDAIAAYRALLDSGVVPTRLVVAGDSAGGGLAASLLVALRDGGLPLPVRAVLLCPWVDMGAKGGSIESNSTWDVFNPPLIEFWARSVLAGADAADPRASPVHADLRGLPPLLVQVGGVEMLLDQDVAFAERAKAAGVEVTLRIWDDCMHDWPLYATVLRRGGPAIAEMATFIRGNEAR